MKLSIVLLVVLAAIAGYVLGTDQGRSQKDQVIKKIRRQTDDAVDAAMETAEVAEAKLEAALDEAATAANN